MTSLPSPSTSTDTSTAHCIPESLEISLCIDLGSWFSNSFSCNYVLYLLWSRGRFGGGSELRLLSSISEDGRFLCLLRQLLLPVRPEYWRLFLLRSSSYLSPTSLLRFLRFDRRRGIGERSGTTNNKQIPYSWRPLDRSSDSMQESSSGQLQHASK